MEWRFIRNTNKEYMVSDTGLIKSLKTNKVLSPGRDTKGYLRCSICVNGISKTRIVHRLVAEYFIDNPENKPEINHKNGVKTDNRVENLEWCTRSENIKHAFDNGLQSNKGENHPRSKLNELQVRVIRRLKGDQITQKEIAKIFGVTQALVSTIQRRTTWKPI